jgi:TRAP-type C4-dicarboxylate transport system permease small subunit
MTRGELMKFIRNIQFALKKIDYVLDKFQKAACVLFLINMVVAGSIQVFGRFIFKSAPAWTEELMRFSMIYLGFFSASLTARKDGHVSMDLLQEKLKNNKTRMKFYVITRLLMVAFCAILVPWGFQLVRRVTRSMGSSLKISWSYIYVAVPIGCAMLIICILAHLPDFAALVEKGEK